MNPDAATATLARWQAHQRMKLVYRHAGRKATSIPYRELCEDADRYLVEHRDELMEWATRACAQIKTSVPRKRR